MSSGLAPMDAELLIEPVSAPDPGLAPIGPLTGSSTYQAGLAPEVAQRVIGGTSALGMGVLIERGSGFLANILAARFGGAQTFGAYSLAISTANQISTYAAGGIGATATRFSGKYPYGSRGYSSLARALAVVSIVSAALAAVALLFGAGPIAHLLGKAQLATLLRWAALSAAGIILLECARGFFVGQRRLVALVLLSVLVGSGMVLLLPAAARMHRPTHMIILQGCITSGAVLVCLLLYRPLGLHAPEGTARKSRAPLGPILREVWGFGLIQLAGLVGSNLAGWWLMTLVARADTTLVQMSFFAIASQLRNLAGIAPGLLTEGSYAAMAEPETEATDPKQASLQHLAVPTAGKPHTSTPHRVMALCSFASLAVSFLLAAIGMTIVPWLLTLLYGRTYAAAGLAVALGLAIAVVHMGNAPAAARLTIVAIRATGVINTAWALFVAAAATLFLVFGGGAAAAMGIYFVAHVLSSSLVLLTLRRKDGLPAGMAGLFLLSTAASAVLAALATVRALRPTLTLPLTCAMCLTSALALTGLFLMGKKYRWMPSAAAVAAIGASLRGRVARLLPRRAAHV
jgi:hypothetical protein